MAGKGEEMNDRLVERVKCNSLRGFRHLEGVWMSVGIQKDIIV